MSDAVENIFAPHLSGFPNYHSSQSTIIVKFIENCKFALDNNNIVWICAHGSIKGFDRLPYHLLINKLNTYGFHNDACMLTACYFTGRKQCFRRGGNKSEWTTISKCAPQGSILECFVFNLFQNDLVSKLKNKCDVYNYADDNMVDVYDRNYDGLHIKLRQVGNEMLKSASELTILNNITRFQQQFSVKDYKISRIQYFAYTASSSRLGALLLTITTY